MSITQSNRVTRHGGRYAVAGVAAAALLLAGCASSTDPVAGGADWLEDLEPMTLTVAEVNPPDSAQANAWLAFEEEITRATGGKVEFENFFGASLLAGTETLEGIGGGVADLGSLAPTYFPSELPVLNWLEAFGAAEFDSTIQAQLAGSGAAYEDLLTNKPVAAELEGVGMHALGAASSPPYDMLCEKPADSVSDLAGLRVRSSGDFWSDGLEALGMTPVSVEFSELYESLQRGVIDCVVMTGPVYVNAGLVEVAKDYVPVALPQFRSYLFAANQDVWASFPLELQEIFKSAAVHFPAVGAAQNLDELAKFAKAEGVVYHDATEMNDILAGHYADAIDNLVDSAPDSVADPAAVVDDYLARLESWRAIADGVIGEGDPDAEDLQQEFLAYEGLALDDYETALRDAVTR